MDENQKNGWGAQPSPSLEKWYQEEEYNQTHKNSKPSQIYQHQTARKSSKYSWELLTILVISSRYSWHMWSTLQTDAE